MILGAIQLCHLLVVRERRERRERREILGAVFLGDEPVEEATGEIIPENGLFCEPFR